MKHFSPHLENIYGELIYWHFLHKKNVKWLTSSLCCFLLCPHKLFLLFVYISTCYACIPIYATTNLFVVIVISFITKVFTTVLTSPFLNHHSYHYHHQHNQNQNHHNIKTFQWITVSKALIWKACIQLILIYMMILTKIMCSNQ